MLVFWFQILPDHVNSRLWLIKSIFQRERDRDCISHYIPLYSIISPYSGCLYPHHIPISLDFSTFPLGFSWFSVGFCTFSLCFSMVFHIFTSVWNVDRWRYGNGEGVLLMSVVLTADLKDWRDWRPVGDLMRSLDSFHQIGVYPEIWTTDFLLTFWATWNHN